MQQLFLFHATIVSVLQRVQVADSLNLQCLLMLFIQEKDVICNRKRRYLSQKLQFLEMTW